MPVLDRFLSLVSNILDDKALTALLSTAKGSSKPSFSTTRDVTPRRSESSSVAAYRARSALTSPSTAIAASASPAPRSIYSMPREFKVLQRPPEDEDMLDLTYNSKVILRGLAGRFAVIDEKGSFVSQVSFQILL